MRLTQMQICMVKKLGFNRQLRIRRIEVLADNMHPFDMCSSMNLQMPSAHPMGTTPICPVFDLLRNNGGNFQGRKTQLKSEIKGTVAGSGTNYFSRSPFLIYFFLIIFKLFFLFFYFNYFFFGAFRNWSKTA